LVRILAPDERAIQEAAGILKSGGLVAFPTETVYGLGAIATNDRAVSRIFSAKRRPLHNPLICHVRDRSAANPLVVWNDAAVALAETFWPGPLTLVVTREPSAPLSPLVTAGLPTVAVRAPSAPTARRLLEETLLPLAAPSANPSGRVSPTTAEHVADGLDDAVDLVLDGGPCSVGLESTVVDVSAEAPILLRPGGVDRAALEAVVGPLAAAGAEAPVRSPGQLPSHYAPTRPVRLDVTAPAPDEAYLAFGDVEPGGAVSANLSQTGDLAEAARNLFAMLRMLDRDDVRAIAVAPIPREGIGEALNDRLARAAAEREL
jgi:L-threonylcarbamoyladenylate synthase